MTIKKTLLSVFTGIILIAFLAAPTSASHCCMKQKQDAGKCKMLDMIPNVTPEQKEQIMKVCSESQTAMKPLCEALAKEHQALMELLKNPVDQAQIEAKIDNVAKMKADMMKKCLGCCLAIRNLLTDEQKAKFMPMNCCCGGQMGMGCGFGNGKIGCGVKKGCSKAAGKVCDPKACPMHQNTEKK